MVLSLFTSCQSKILEEKPLAKSTFLRTEKNEDYIYDVYEDYTVITEYIGEDFRVSVPNKLGGKDVKGIGEKAFAKSMLAIDVIDIPKNVEYIDPSAFYGKTSLTAFTVAEGNCVYKSDKGIIYSKDGQNLLHYPIGKSDEKFTVKSGIVKIGAYAFGGSDKIVEVVLPDTVTEIGGHAFEGCEKLVKVNIPEKVTVIPDYCFSECRAMASITFPSALTKIGTDAFYYCISITSVEIPDSVVEISDEAFRKCETLTKARLSKSLSKYGYKVFAGCKLLTDIDVSEENRVYKSTEGLVYSYDGKTLVEAPYGRYFKNLVINDDVTAIRAYCFFKDYKEQGGDDFESISSIDFKNVETIGSYAFANRDSIREVKLPSCLKEIASTAFNYCKNIEKYSIKDNENYVVQDGVLFTKDKKTIVAYPTNREKNTYKIPDGTENLGDYSFSYCYSLHEIEIPESIKTVGNYCFYMTSSVVGSIKFGKNLKSIGKYCFSNCSGLEGITFTDNTITEIPEGAFHVLDGVEEFYIPEGVTKIGKDAFRESGYILFVKIPSSVKEIGTHAFYDMDDLHSLTIPKSVETIGDEIVTIMDESNPDKVTLKVYKDSVAEQYAVDNNIPYEFIK